MNLKAVVVVTIIIFAIQNNVLSRDITNLISDKDQVISIPESVEPELGVWFEDLAFETKIKRITDASKHRIPVYSKTQPWNADGSLMILYQTGGGGHYLYSGTTYEEVGPLPNRYDGNKYSPGDLENIWWHPEDPNILIYPSNPSNSPNTPSIVRNNIKTNVIEIIREFPEYSDGDKYAFGAMGEGNMSNDARMVALRGKNGSGNDEFFAYDMIDDIKYESKVISEQDVGQYGPDWVSISPSGKYIVINAVVYGVYDLNMNLLRIIDIPGGHADMAIDVDGEDVIVLIDHDSPKAPRLVKVRLSDGEMTDLMYKASNQSWGFVGTHISCRNSKLPGWAYISTVDGAGNDAPFYREVYRVKMDGSKEVGRIAHHRSTGDPYWSEPHVAVNWDGTKLIWGSNWGSRDLMTQTYVCDISEDFDTPIIMNSTKNVISNNYTISNVTKNSFLFNKKCKSNLEIDIYSINGKCLYKSKINKSSVSESTLIKHNQNLSAGLYLISIKVEMEMFNDKLQINEK